MARLTYAQAKDVNGDDLLAILASGKNPDGTDYTLPTTASVSVTSVELEADGATVGAANPLPTTATLSGLDTDDLDTGAGTDTQAIMGLALAESGGHVMVGSGNPLPVSGTITETNSAAILADTASMDTNLATLAGAVAGTEVQVDVLTMPTVTETNSAAILADTASMDTNIGTIAGDTTSIDGKITACDTTALATEAGNLATIAGDTTSIDGKITACDTSGLATESGGNLDTIAGDTTSMDTNLATLAGAVSGTEVQVDVLTMPTVTETNSAAILADTASMDTNLGTLAGAVSGSEMQVDVVAALPAGTNAIGKLAANSGVDIGDVTINNTSAVPVSAGTTTHDCGTKAMTGSAVQLDSASAKVVTFTADTGVVDQIAIGDNGAVSTEGSQTGIILAAGESVTLEVPSGNLNIFYAHGTSGDDLSWYIQN